MRHPIVIITLILFFHLLSSNVVLLKQLLKLNPEKCTKICAERKFLLPKLKDVENICERGCRFFNIYNFAETETKSALELCQNTCIEAYECEKPCAACKMGCQALLYDFEVDSKKMKQHLRDAQKVSEDLNPDEDYMFESDFETFDAMLQIRRDYKIPEYKVQTMPIDIEKVNVQTENPPFFAKIGNCLDRRMATLATDCGFPIFFLGALLAVASLLIYSFFKGCPQICELAESNHSKFYPDSDCDLPSGKLRIVAFEGNLFEDELEQKEVISINDPPIKNSQSNEVLNSTPAMAI